MVIVFIDIWFAGAVTRSTGLCRACSYRRSGRHANRRHLTHACFVFGLLILHHRFGLLTVPSTPQVAHVVGELEIDTYLGRSGDAVGNLD